jgi:hypothetical protein
VTGFVPAPHPPLARIVTKGGPIIAKPRLVAVTFAGDPLADQLEAFVRALGGSMYFAQIGADYGVGPASALAPVRVAESGPASATDVDVKGWIAGKLDGTHPEFSPAADDVIYVLFYPQTTTLREGGAQSCDGFIGYHDATKVLTGATAVYAVVARCAGVSGVPDPLDAATAAASHEIIEAASDPEGSAPAYSDTDDDDPAWPLIFRGGEVADLCELPESPYVKPDALGFTVHRVWSNAAAQAGHAPCLPAPVAPYWNSVPVLADTVTLNVNGASVAVRGVKIALGASRTIDLALFSDAPTSGPWSVRAVDLPAISGGSQQLELKASAPSGTNGDVVRLTIKVLAHGPFGGEPFLVESTLGGRTTFAVGLVGE